MNSTVYYIITPFETKRESKEVNKMEKNQPEKKFRAGAIAATVWANKGQNKEGEETSFNTISFERSYKDKDGKWKSTSSLRINDLPRAVVVLNKAYEYIILKGRATGEIPVESVC
jgi:hypothetical protein